MIRARGVAFVLLTACMACMVAGCGHKNSVSDEMKQLGEETQSVEQNVTQRSDASVENTSGFQQGTLSQSLGMKDGTWQETIAVGQSGIQEIQIDAEVELPDTDHMCVMDLERREISESQVKQIIGALFDDGKIGVLKGDNYPKWKLEQLVSECEAMIEENLKFNQEEEYLKENTAMLDEYSKQLKNATNDMIEPEVYDSGFFWGMRDGRVWDFNIGTFFVEDGYAFGGGIANYAEVLLTEMDYNGCIVSYSDVDEDVENACIMSKEEAIKQATDFLCGLGYDEYSIKKVSNMSWNVYRQADHSEENFVEGYTVYFGREIDGVQISDVTTKYAFVSSGYDFGDVALTLKYEDEGVYVSVTDAGVIRFRICAPCNVKGEKTVTSLLSYDRIQERFKTVIGDHVQAGSILDDGYGVVKLNHMDLVYMVLTDDGLTVVPVWRLCEWEEDSSIINFVLLNAIDGSEIDYVSEYYELRPIEEIQEQYD